MFIINKLLNLFKEYIYLYSYTFECFSISRKEAKVYKYMIYTYNCVPSVLHLFQSKFMTQSLLRRIKYTVIVIVLTAWSY